MAIASEDIERIRATIVLSELISPHVQLRRVGQRWAGRCPFHAEKTPSFYVNDESGFYKCFGCGVSGDVFTFVAQTEHVDFPGACEILAGKAGITLTVTDSSDNRARQRRKQLHEALERAIEWYHQRLLTSADAGAARSYLRSRGLVGDVVRRFRIGWAPDAWDELTRDLKLPDDIVRDSGLGFINQRGRQTDAFRARILFPIFNENGQPVALGGRVMPGAEGAKYKNSPETPVYTKSRTLYGLNWAKDEAVREDQLVVCEGYTDVIGFHQAGVARAVATCGTALTEEHVRLMKRFANRIVLAFDADAAGLNAADRFYAWEKQYDVTVSVAQFPSGVDPADLARTQPDALARAVEEAKPFLGFRLDRLLNGARLRSPEDKARTAEAALALIAEHPNVIVRREYAAEVAMRCSLDPGRLVALAESGARSARVETPSAPAERPNESAEVTALRLLVHQWDAIAPYLIEALFADEVNLAAFRALAETGGDVVKAVEVAGPGADDLLRRLSVEEAEHDAAVEGPRLISQAVRRELDRSRARGDADELATTGEPLRLVHELDDERTGPEAASELLAWLERRSLEQS
jgi:DNA primase